MPLPDDARRIMRRIVIRGAVLEAEKATIDFEQFIEQMRAAGASDAEIRRIILEDFRERQGRLFRPFETAVKDVVSAGIHQAHAAGLVDQASADEMLRWTTTTEEGVTCEDCEGRAGEIRTLAEWTDLGLPASGFSRCGSRCRCVLTPVEAGAPDRVEVAEPT